MQLVPALTVIESNLFPPVADLTCAPEAWAEVDFSAAVPPLPAQLAAMIAARVDTAAHFAAQSPRPGVIVRLRAPHALTVLLTAATSTGWQGYVVTSETDYATAADVLVEPDAACDPQAALVQTWNDLTIQTTMIDTIIGELSAAQRASIADIATEWRTEQRLDAVAAPGMLWQRATASDQLVVTGTPLGSANDPRRRYQALYRAAALRVQSAASAPATAPPSWLEQALLGLRAAAHSWQVALEPVLQPTLGGNAATQWRIANMLELELIAAAGGDAVQIRAHWQPPQAVRIELIATDGQVRQRQQLDATCPQADLFAGVDEQLTLRIYALDERLLFAAPFPDLLPAIHYGNS